MQDEAAFVRHPAGGSIVHRVQQLQSRQPDHILFSQCPPGYCRQSAGGDASPPGVGSGPIADLGRIRSGDLHRHVADDRPIIVLDDGETETRGVGPADRLCLQPVSSLGRVGQ